MSCKSRLRQKDFKGGGEGEGERKMGGCPLGWIDRETEFPGGSQLLDTDSNFSRRVKIAWYVMELNFSWFYRSGSNT